MSAASTRLVFLVSACSVLVPESFAQWVTPQENSAPPVEIAEQLTVDIVGTLFLFDQLFIKSATVTSPGYLERVSKPSSKFYTDYLESKGGRISRTELVRRLPHIAMLGDSQSKNMYLSSIPSLFWRSRTERRKNWFLDTDPSPESIYSVYERLEKLTPLVATEYTSNGAKVAPGQITPDFPRKLGRTRNFSGQVNRVIRNKRFPDLVMILIGNNNLNWVEIVSSTEREHPEKRLREIAEGFGENYTQQLRVLIDRAKTQNHKVAVVVFGLVDFEKYFKVRQKAEALHASNRKLYPYIGMTSWIYPSLKAVYQKDTTRLALMINGEMRTMVNNLSKELTDYPDVRLQYSDAFSNLNDSRLELVHPVDAMHLSRAGHNAFAQAAFTAISPSLEFLGINPNRAGAR
jgi:lysophospholipase L1-like esterase